MLLFVLLLLFLLMAVMTFFTLEWYSPCFAFARLFSVVVVAVLFLVVVGVVTTVVVVAVVRFPPVNNAAAVLFPTGTVDLAAAALIFSSISRLLIFAEDIDVVVVFVWLDNAEC